MDLDDIVAFVKVVQAGSFSQAARLLGMSDLLETSRRAPATHRSFQNVEPALSARIVADDLQAGRAKVRAFIDLAVGPAS